MKIALFFFKVFSFIIYTLFHAFELCFIACFPLCLRHLQNNFQVTVNNMNNTRMTERSKGGYDQNCQTSQCKCQLTPENTQCCQGSKYK